MQVAHARGLQPRLLPGSLCGGAKGGCSGLLGGLLHRMQLHLHLGELREDLPHELLIDACPHSSVALAPPRLGHRKEGGEERNERQERDHTGQDKGGPETVPSEEHAGLQGECQHDRRGRKPGLPH